jgi:hypothetical protein
MCFDLPETLGKSPDTQTLSHDDIVRIAIETLDNDPSAKVREVTKALAEQYGTGAKELYNAVVGLRRK